MSIHSIIHSGITFRQRWCRSKRIKNFMNHELRVNIPFLTNEQKKMVDEVWKGIRVDYKWFAFFNTFNEDGCEWTPLYIPSNLYYSIVDMHYTDYKNCRTIEDKNLNNLLFYDVKQPATIARRIGGIYMDGEYNNVTLDEIKKIFSTNSSYIIKPSIDSGGGKSILVYKAGEEEQYEDFINSIKLLDNCIVQEFASQHEQLASLHPDSLNTVRIMTFFHNGRSKALSTIIRIGVGEGRIDNASAGGIFVGVKNDGSLKNIAYNDYGEKFFVHPSTNAHFEDHHIPGYDKLIQLAEYLHNRFVVFSKLISWDFAIDNNGDPILIEMNATLGGISFHQMCNGPLFGDMTQEVIKEVFNKKNRTLSKIL